MTGPCVCVCLCVHEYGYLCLCARACVCVCVYSWIKRYGHSEKDKHRNRDKKHFLTIDSQHWLISAWPPKFCKLLLLSLMVFPEACIAWIHSWDLSWLHNQRARDASSTTRRSICTGRNPHVCAYLCSLVRRRRSALRQKCKKNNIRNSKAKAQTFTQLHHLFSELRSSRDV